MRLVAPQRPTVRWSEYLFFRSAAGTETCPRSVSVLVAMPESVIKLAYTVISQDTWELCVELLAAEGLAGARVLVPAFVLEPDQPSGPELFELGCSNEPFFTLLPWMLTVNVEELFVSFDSPTSPV